MGDKELKPKSFRIDDDTAERIKAITAEIGGNQQEALSKMIEAFEFQKGKAILLERKADIERFEGYTSLLVRMFMGVLEDNQNVGETIRVEFAAQLNAKDLTIRDLQEKCGAVTSDYEASVLRLERLREANASTSEQLEKTRSELNDREKQFSSMLSDKENLNKALASSIEDLKEQNAKMTEEVLTARDAAARLEESIKKNAALEQDLASLRKQLGEVKEEAQRNVLQASQSKEIEFEKKMIEVEKLHQAALQEIERVNRAEIDNYQSKYLSLLERMKEQGFAHGEQQNRAKKKTEKQGDKQSE
jgi:predicted  nucleic acid-binding Zn-ribbon protein